VKNSEIYGFLPLLKEKGTSSNQEIQFLKRRLSISKIGHCGTLDPISDGVLPVLVNKATRTMRYFLNYEKRYSFVIQFGIATDTLDIAGKIISTSNRVIHKDELENVLNTSSGTYFQKTPAFSARKYKGKSLYYYAKKGIEVPRKEKEVYIRSIILKEFDFPFARIEIVCGSGTYIRQLTEDICTKLNIKGTVYSLRRISYGVFNLSNSKIAVELSLNDIIPITDVFTDFGRFEIKNNYIILAKNGSVISKDDCKDLYEGERPLYFGMYEKRVIGIYRLDNMVFHPEVILG